MGLLMDPLPLFITTVKQNHGKEMISYSPKLLLKKILKTEDLAKGKVV